MKLYVIANVIVKMEMKMIIMIMEITLDGLISSIGKLDMIITKSINEIKTINVNNSSSVVMIASVLYYLILVIRRVTVLVNSIRIS